MIKNFKAICAVGLVAVIAFSSVACGKKDTNTSATSDNTSSRPDIPGNKQDSYGDAVSLLNAVWASYEKSEKFPVSGGDESHLNFEGPGEYSTENAEMLDDVLGFPTELVSKIDSAASLSHAINSNTFTCGAFRFKTESDAKSAVEKIKANILGRQWVCGFPDSIMIISVPGNYVIALWGIDEGTGIVTLFNNKALNTLDGAETVVWEAII